ncbi:U-scoloptoxin(01)-Er1a-like isoform X2 [Vespula squamosa]|uniref:U-scoloptoxin(01)-Er1a-like isoform X2 n=1 Tax=Vespula squamosa TaxID=30214 RepID=A0ABD1ZZ47_VESSQ
MNRFVFIQIFCAFVFAIHALPQQPKSKRPIPVFKQNQLGGLQLPDNATLIRDNIVDTFSCKERIYGYYADMENDCQIFHVCLPQTRNVAKWSFICPSETVFNQATFVCTRTEESIPCEESEKYYSLNEEIGKEEENTEEETTRSLPVNADVEPVTNKPFTRTSRILNRQGSSQRH